MHIDVRGSERILMQRRAVQNATSGTPAYPILRLADGARAPIAGRF
jgi:hypothetical protein